jgi:hypothetical protein
MNYNTILKSIFPSSQTDVRGVVRSDFSHKLWRPSLGCCKNRTVGIIFIAIHIDITKETLSQL